MRRALGLASMLVIAFPALALADDRFRCDLRSGHILEAAIRQSMFEMQLVRAWSDFNRPGEYTPPKAKLLEYWEQTRGPGLLEPVSDPVKFGPHFTPAAAAPAVGQNLLVPGRKF